MNKKNDKQHPQRLTLRTDVRAGFDWSDLWTDIKEVGNDIGTGVGEAADAAKSGIHNATASE